MRERHHEYFTYWAAAGGALGYAALLYCRLRDEGPRAGIAVFLVSLAVVVSIIGTDTVGRHLAIPHRRARAVYSAHLLVHVLPLVAAAALLSAWRTAVRQRVTSSAACGGLAAAAGLFASYASVPLVGTSEVFVDKVRVVYNVADPERVVAAGVALGAAGAGMAALASHRP